MTHWTLIDIVNDLLCVVIACLWTRLRWLAEDEARAEAQRCLCQNEMETDK